MLGKAIDVWALGVTLYCFLYGRVPYGNPRDNVFEVYQRIRNDVYARPRTACAPRACAR